MSFPWVSTWAPRELAVSSNSSQGLSSIPVTQAQVQFTLLWHKWWWSDLACNHLCKINFNLFFLTFSNELGFVGSSHLLLESIKRLLQVQQSKQDRVTVLGCCSSLNVSRLHNLKFWFTELIRACVPTLECYGADWLLTSRINLSSRTTRTIHLITMSLSF